MNARGLFFAAAGLAMAFSLTGCSESINQPGNATSNGSLTNSAMAIAPHLSVGEIRSGMTLPQVVAALGEPQQRTAKALEYRRLGLAVLPGPDGHVQYVMCGDVTGINGPLVKAFTGRTKEGIGMNSSREEIVKAYGEASEARKLPEGLESLLYESLGMKFTLQGGRIHHIIIALAPAEPDRTVNLEPLPK